MSYRAHAILAAVMVLATLCTFYWWIHRDPASAGSSVSGEALNTPVPLPPVAPTEPAWRRELRDEVLAFRWTEVLANEDVDHHGGVLFVQRDGRLYSRAWFGKAQYAQPWPAVEGIGALAHNTLSIAYRSSSNDAVHEFYYADCHFSISPDGKLFKCQFQQRANMNDEGDLSPGQARGVRVMKMDDTYQRELDALWAFIEKIYAVETSHEEGMPHCMVLPHKHADPSIHTVYKGVQYGFCCDSCRKVFLADPQPFIEIRTAPGIAP